MNSRHFTPEEIFAIGRHELGLPPVTTKMYALIARGLDYPCGSAIGIFTTRKLAEDAKGRMEAVNPQKEPECYSFEIAEVETNMVYKKGLNGCLACCSCLVNPYEVKQTVDVVPTEKFSALSVSEDA